MSSSVTSRVLIVDDHPLVRAGLSMRLSMSPQFDVCGEADGEDDAIALIQQTHPDLVIVDISLRQGHGIDLIKRIKDRFAPIRMLVISGHEETLYAERALRAGAHGYLNKRHSNEHLVAAVTTVCRGQLYLSEEMAHQLSDELGHKGGSDETPVDRLSDRELQVFELIGVGLTSRAIAHRLHLSPHTIDTHRENIKRKLGLHSAAQLARSAVQWRLETE